MFGFANQLVLCIDCHVGCKFFLSFLCYGGGYLMKHEYIILVQKIQSGAKSFHKYWERYILEILNRRASIVWYKLWQLIWLMWYWPKKQEHVLQQAACYQLVHGLLRALAEPHHSCIHLILLSAYLLKHTCILNFHSIIISSSIWEPCLPYITKDLFGLPLN